MKLATLLFLDVWEGADPELLASLWVFFFSSVKAVSYGQMILKLPKYVS